MKFLVDAQLPKKLSKFLLEQGFESTHTLDLPDKNLTPDLKIIELSIKNNWIVITKDIDFYNHYLQKSEPYKLIYLTVGNASVGEILDLFEKNLSMIVEIITHNYVVEITRKNIITIL